MWNRTSSSSGLEVGFAKDIVSRLAGILADEELLPQHLELVVGDALVSLKNNYILVYKY